jgi:hypothetical protein
MIFWFQSLGPLDSLTGGLLMSQLAVTAVSINANGELGEVENLLA